MPKLGVGGRQGRHQNNHVAERAQENAAIAERQTNAVSVAMARIERCFRISIGHELDAAHQSSLANIPDVTMSGKRMERLSKHARFLFHSTDDGAIR
jgi:hypothetical protein